MWFFRRVDVESKRKEVEVEVEVEEEEGSQLVQIGTERDVAEPSPKRAGV